jgi:hypothetical protein
LQTTGLILFVAAAALISHIGFMSKLIEIQQQIERLPTQEKKALSAWLASQENAAMSDQEEAALLANLDEAERQLDAGQGVPIDQVRRMVPLWVTK